MERENLKKYNLPDAPGVYVFLARRSLGEGGRGARNLSRIRPKSGNVLYIGKATSLRDRVRSYFSADLAVARGSRISGMVEEAKSITWEETDSVLEALILEANLIKRHEPPYNIREKDNRSFNYLVITDENFPRVLTIRGRELNLKAQTLKPKAMFGPFPSGGSLREALKMVRKIFPFRDKCTPISQQRGKTSLLRKACFNRQIGLCPGVCSGEVSKSEYARTIHHIKLLFSGKKNTLIKQLEREMKAYAKAEKFEEAANTRRQIDSLTHIRDIALLKNDNDKIGHRASDLGRIEGYDVAHTSGKETVGVMTVVDCGEVARGEYRKFKLRGVENNDVKALEQILERRLGHPEWQMPKLIVVDGGKAQVNVARRVLKKAGVQISVVGVVKNEKHKPREIIGDKKLTAKYEKEILLVNNEAHRFAISWHRKRRGTIR